jgi:DNA-binding SARP family transcriptional activator
MSEVSNPWVTGVLSAIHVAMEDRTPERMDLELIEALLCAARRAAAKGDQRLVRMCQAAYCLSLAGSAAQTDKKAYWEGRFETCLREIVLPLDAPDLQTMASRCDTQPPDAIAGGASSTIDLASAPDWLERFDVTGVNPAHWAQEAKTIGSEQAQTGSAAAERGPIESAVGPWRFAGVEPRAPAVSEMERPAAMSVYLLSPFRVLVDDEQVPAWPNCRGKSIFKYLVVNRQRPIAKEVLMETFWPQTPMAAARNSLNVAICGLRKSLAVNGSNFPFVVFSEGCYRLNPDLRLWVDAEEFNEHLANAAFLRARGRHSAALEALRAAEAIYQSELLVEDRYDEWLVDTRKRFEERYLALIDELLEYEFERGNYRQCLPLAAKSLAIEPCHELAHRKLMDCYGRMGKRALAIRQFHACAEALSREFKLAPSAETLALFHRLRQMNTH